MEFVVIEKQGKGCFVCFSTIDTVLNKSQQRRRLIDCQMHKVCYLSLTVHNSCDSVFLLREKGRMMFGSDGVEIIGVMRRKKTDDGVIPVDNVGFFCQKLCLK